ncbi:MAG TPA: hypothetical protein VG122_19645, partial [Gemmata sp.]|nr:hypothetical protein [Gemmata sp.]
VPTVAEVEAAIRDLMETDNKVRIASADKLAKCYTVLPDRRADVAKALVPLATDKDAGVSRAVQNALKLWIGPEVVKDLVALLEKADVGPAQHDLIALIAPYKEPAASNVLAKCLNSQNNRGHAEPALKAIGPAAEKAVIPILEVKDGWSVQAACRVLKEIGTKESIAPLQALIDKKPDVFTTGAADDALKTIKKRN